MPKGNSATSRGRRIVLIVTCLAALTAGGAGYWYWGQASAGAHAARTAARAGVPVTVAIVQRQDVPIYLSGLGTVQASFTVGIHSQVDGKLQEVLFTEGQQVKKGDVLAKIDPRLFQAALDQAKAKKAQDIAQFISASKDLERSNTLVKSNITSQQIVDQQQGKVDQLRAMIDADEAMIQTAQTNLDYTSITAHGGRMGVRLVDPGNIVHANDQGSIATLVLTRPSAVLFTLPARALDDIRAAMARGPVEVTAFDQDNRRALATGTLLLVDNTIDQATATIRLKAMFPNEDDKLWPGEFVNARVLLETRSNAVVVPSAAIQRGPEGLFVWTVTANSRAEPRPIESGPANGNLIIVTSGLNGGERVVVDGHYKLQRNVPVTVSSPASPQTAGSGGNS
ncbi:MAG: efflux RND transporter periplasmic adaptor subunit [Hyphomicrobiales bacterium]|nr:efflux RND transporter periplasmic adaptor subunit [Hyphomicrobiales bacterium]